MYLYAKTNKLQLVKHSSLPSFLTVVVVSIRIGKILVIQPAANPALPSTDKCI